MSANFLQIKSNYIAGLTSAGDDTTTTVKMSLGVPADVNAVNGVKFTDSAGANILKATTTNLYFGANSGALVTDAGGVRTINSDYAKISSILASTLTVINVSEISTSVSSLTVYNGEFNINADATGRYNKSTIIGLNDNTGDVIANMYDISTETSRAKSAEGSLDTRATSDEKALSSEVSRASSAEGSLDDPQAPLGPALAVGTEVLLAVKTPPGAATPKPAGLRPGF